MFVLALHAVAYYPTDGCAEQRTLLSCTLKQKVPLHMHDRLTTVPSLHISLHDRQPLYLAGVVYLYTWFAVCCEYKEIN